MKCNTCNANQAMTDNQRGEYRVAGWVGIDFYGAICVDCFDSAKDEN